jgi:hypothetical protein
MRQEEIIDGTFGTSTEEKFLKIYLKIGKINTSLDTNI